MLILNKEEVRNLLSIKTCIGLVEQSMIETSKGNALLPLRYAMELPDNKGKLGIMPGYLGNPACFGVKLLSLFPSNSGTCRSSHLGCLMLFDSSTGSPLAIMDAGKITAIRTAAASAVATRLLARKESKTLAILGTGEQAASHLEALLHSHDFSLVKIWGRTPANAEKFVTLNPVSNAVSVEVVDTAEQAVAEADVICTVTSAKSPILSNEWIPEGAHLNLVGASSNDYQEIDMGAVAKFRYFVDFRESALNQAAELIQAMNAGLCDESAVAGELGELLLDEMPGRRSDREITLYRSLGIATQDLAVASWLYSEARKKNAGQQVAF